MYDIIIIGGGPAGLTAAIYGARFNLKVLVLADSVGGHAAEAYLVENYPGFGPINGMELMNKMGEQAESQGVEIRFEHAAKIRKTPAGFKVTSGGGEYDTRTVLIASGTERQRLGVKGEAEFAGKGVSYCATCDGFFFKGRTVAIIGGGDAALSGAEMLADLAVKVYIVHRRQEFRGEPVKLDRLKSKPNIQFVLDCIVEEVRGDKAVNAIIIKNVVTGAKTELMVDGVFVEIGAVPSSDVAKELGAELDSSGYIIVDDAQKTTIEGVYAAGDISTGSNRFRQIITAAAEGAIAANAIYRYLKSKFQ